MPPLLSSGPRLPGLACDRFVLLVGLSTGLGLTLSGAPAVAAGTDGASAVLPAITVVGEKVERSLYDTGASVEVYDAERIDDTPAVSELADILKNNPAIVDVGVGNHMPAVRGVDGSGPSIGGVATFAGVRPRLNVTLDGRSLSYGELASSTRPLWDMERIETYVGPQSQIQGRNAIAGTVVMETRDPSFQWEGAVKGGIGNQGYSQTAAMVSGPLLRDELAFRVAVDQQKRESYVDLASYEPVGDSRDIESNTARVKLQYEPAALPDFSTGLTYSHMDTQSPQAEYELSNPPSRQANAYRPVYTTDSSTTSWDALWEVSDGLRFENTLLYSELEVERKTQNSVANYQSDGTEYYIEPLLHFGEGDQGVRGLVGLRYFHAEADEAYINTTGRQPMSDETDTRSAFGEVTYPLSDVLDLTMGLRFESEHRQRMAQVQLNPVFGVDLDLDETYTALLPKVDLAWRPTDGQTIGFKVAKGYNAGGAGLTLTSFEPYEYDKETVISYEFYTRHRLSGGAVELTTNLFYNDYSDMQLPEYVTADDIVIRNADEAISYGMELGSRWKVSDALSVTGNLALLKTEVTEFGNTLIEGNELPRSPGKAATVGAEYRFMQNLALSANARYTDSYYSDYDNLAAEKIDAYTVVDAQMAYDHGPARVTVFVKNLFDTDANTMIFNGLVDNPLKVQPRMVGGSLEYQF